MGWMVGGAGLPRLPLLPEGARFVPALARKEIPSRPACLCAVLLLVLVRRLRGEGGSLLNGLFHEILERCVIIFIVGKNNDALKKLCFIFKERSAEHPIF